MTQQQRARGEAAGKGKITKLSPNSHGASLSSCLLS
jgi:hypothetical protein